jgi:hypothetical protein
MTQVFRHLLRSILNETSEELGQPFDSIADFMADQVDELCQLAFSTADWNDHKMDLEIIKARDEVKKFAGLSGSHPDHRHILGAIQGSMAVAAQVFFASTPKSA